MSDIARLRTWLVRAAPPRYDLVKALFMATLASVAGTALVVGALALLVASSGRPGLRAIAAFLIALELVAFLRSPLRFGERMSTHRLGFAAVTHWRQWLMNTVGTWSFSRWQTYATGDLLERSLSDTDELQDLWLRGVIPSVATLITMVISDAAVGVLAPFGHWWPVAVSSAVLQFALIIVIAARLGPLVRADRRLRACRGDFVASLVSSRAAAPEIERLGAADFLRRRDEVTVADLRDAEDAMRRERQRDTSIVLVGPLGCLALLFWLHPASATLWLVVASLVGIATFDALATLRGVLHTAVAVTGGAERLDELASVSRAAHAAWPLDTTLRFHDVVVSHSSEGIVRVSGTAVPGRRLGVSGPSGAGKSTLLRALGRLDDLNGGAIDVGAVPLDDIGEDQLRAHVILVPSEPGLVRGYVRDVVGMGRTLRDADLAALARLGLDVQLNDQWTQLSRGERQRVALVRALVREPDILLLDEPTSALGEHETDAVLDLLSHTTATVIVATHDPRVLGWCDEVIVLANGVAT